LLIATMFAIYSGLEPLGDSSLAISMGLASFVLCPGSLLFVTFIDAEPWTSGFFFMWLVIGTINVVIYGAVANLIERLRRTG